MMQALTYKLKVNAEGRVEIPVQNLTPGLLVEIIVLVPSVRDAEQESLLFASQTSLAFWDNPVDDEVWNGA